MRNLTNSATPMRSVKKELNVMDLDNDNVLCDEVIECMMDAEQTDASPESGLTNRSDMQQFRCAAAASDDDDRGTKIDHQFMMLLDSFREDGNSYLRENPLSCIRYDVDNGGYDKREFKAVTNKQSREDRNSIRVTKKNVESKPHAKASKKKTTKEAEFDVRRRESLEMEKSVEDSMLIMSHVKRNSQRNVDASKKENSEGQMVCDENYRSYLTWLVENSKSSRNNPEKEIKVKCEEDTVSLSDSDIIAVEDRPFLDEEDSPFVASKDNKVIDLEEERRDQRSSWFKKEIMNILKQPYNKEEFDELCKKVSEHRKSTRYIELRDGTNFSFETKQERPSYLNMYPKFEKKFEAVREMDPHRALNLLRGFFFYLTNVARHDAFKPWRNRECLKITCP